MSIFTKKGLLLSNNLSDISNKDAAVNHLLASFAGGNSDALSLKDLQPLIGINATGFDTAQAFSRITNTPPFEDLGDGTEFSNQTFKNKIDDIQSYTGRASYLGGNGLTGRFYRLVDLPASLRAQIEGTSPEINGSPSDPTDFLNLDQSPNDTTFDELKGINPVFQSDEMWLDGNIDLPQSGSFLKNKADIRVALFTGYFRAGNNHAAAIGEETIDGIMFNPLDYTVESNREIFTNIVVRVLIQDAETNATILNTTYDPLRAEDEGSPREDGPRNVVRLIQNGGSTRSGAGNSATKMFNEFQLCKISIAFFLTNDIINNVSGTKRVRMQFVSASVNGVFNEKINMTRNYFYNDSFPVDDSPYITSLDGQVKTTEKTSLKKYGSLLNLYHSEPAGDSPPIVDPIEKDISQQIGTAESHNNVVIDDILRLTYEPKSGGYNSISKVSFGPSQFEFTSGDNFIRVNADVIVQEDFKSKIEKGNLVQGLVSLATENSKKSAIYVVGLSHRKRVIYLSEPATLDPEEVSDSPAGGIDIIEHRGLMGVGTISGPALTFQKLANGINQGLHGQRDLKAGDFIYVENNSIPGITFADSSPHYLRVKYLSPLTLEEIQSNGTRIEYTTMTGGGVYSKIYYYVPNAIDNQVLDSFCVLDSDGTHQAPLIKLVVEDEVVGTGDDSPAASPSVKNRVIKVKKEAITYQGTKVSLVDQNSPTESSDDIVGRFIVFDGNGVQSVIPPNTRIVAVTNNSPSTDDVDIILDKNITGRIPAGANLTVAKSNDTADKKVICFPPTDPSAPFKTDGEDLSTVPELSREAIDFTTGLAGADVLLQFTGLKLINNSDSPPYPDSPPSNIITKLPSDQSDARYTHRLAIRGNEAFDGGTREVEYFIPLTTRD